MCCEIDFDVLFSRAPVEVRGLLVHDRRGHDPVPRQRRHRVADRVAASQAHDRGRRFRVEEPPQRPAEEETARGVEVHGLVGDVGRHWHLGEDGRRRLRRRRGGDGVGVARAGEDVADRAVGVARWHRGGGAGARALGVCRGFERGLSNLVGPRTDR